MGSPESVNVPRAIMRTFQVEETVVQKGVAVCFGRNCAKIENSDQLKDISRRIADAAKQLVESKNESKSLPVPPNKVETRRPDKPLPPLPEKAAAQTDAIRGEIIPKGKEELDAPPALEDPGVAVIKREGPTAIKSGRNQKEIDKENVLIGKLLNRPVDPGDTKYHISNHSVLERAIARDTNLINGLSDGTKKLTMNGNAIELTNRGKISFQSRVGKSAAAKEAVNSILARASQAASQGINVSDMLGKLKSSEWGNLALRNNPELLTKFNNVLQFAVSREPPQERISKNVEQLRLEVRNMKDNPKLKLHFDEGKFYTDGKGKSDGIGKAAELFHEANKEGVQEIEGRALGLIMSQFMDIPEIRQSIVNDPEALQLVQQTAIDSSIKPSLAQWSNVPDGLRLIRDNWEKAINVLSNPSEFYFDPTSPPIDLKDIMTNYLPSIEEKMQLLQKLGANPMHIAEHGITYTNLQKEEITAKGNIAQQEAGDMSSAVMLINQRINTPMGNTIGVVLQSTLKVALRQLGDIAKNKGGLPDAEINAAVNKAVAETQKPTMDFNIINESLNKLLF